VPLFELVIALLLAGAVLSAWARRINVPYPALLALTGAALALLPDMPSVTLDPELALALFVAPVLLDAAFDSSPRDLKRDWRAVVGLAIVAVAVTIGAVALVARLRVPGLPWPAAIALGAIVAPPDAAAATAVLKQMRPPHRLLVILEGESLFNDASALLVYRLAVAAAAAGSFSPWSALPLLAIVSVGSVLVGAALSRLTLFLVGRVRDVATSVIIQFLTTFGVWILAERLRLSGIITIVTYAIVTARSAPARMPARLRIPSYAVWEVVVFVLNVLAFILVGLQLRPIVQRLDRPQLLDYLVTAAAVCAAVIVVRMLWALAYALVAHWGRRGESADPRFAWRSSLRPAIAIGWSGMRGIVTLAAALALPASFPGRDLVLFTAFSVVLVTLVLQGGTLAPLMRLLRLEDDGTVEGEIRRARAETARAGLEALQGAGENEMTALLTRKYEARLRRADGAGAAAAEQAHDLPGDADAPRRAQEAERRKLLELRDRGVIGDDAFHRVEEELDWADLHAEAQHRTV
jgi:CPA1 family monovalent cation:H+ antiporter